MRNLPTLVLLFFVLAQHAWSGSGLLEDRRLKYHGYFYKNNVLGNENELKEIRKFANTLVFSLVQFDELTPEMVHNIADANWDAFDPAVFDGMAKRIDLLESLDYVTIAEAPFWPLIRFDKFEEYRKTLQFLKKRVPQFAKLDYIYFWDEPDINATPGPEVMEKYIAEFKRVFPKVKVTTCYAIAQEKFLDTVPPDNFDLLMVDPYFLTNEAREHKAADFERFYRSRLALALEWANRWDKPYLMVGDSFGSLSGEGKLFPTPETSLWYYMIAMTQPKCSGLLWFQYGYLETAEKITGVTLEGEPKAVMQMHREVGSAIFGKPSPVGVPWEVREPPLPEMVRKALDPELGE